MVLYEEEIKKQENRVYTKFAGDKYDSILKEGIYN